MIKLWLALCLTWLIGGWALYRLYRLEMLIAGKAGYTTCKGKRIFLFTSGRRGKDAAPDAAPEAE
jgi:hypothetical protein